MLKNGQMDCTDALPLSTAFRTLPFPVTFVAICVMHFRCIEYLWWELGGGWWVVVLLPNAGCGCSDRRMRERKRVVAGHE